MATGPVEDIRVQLRSERIVATFLLVQNMTLPRATEAGYARMEAANARRIGSFFEPGESKRKMAKKTARGHARTLTAKRTLIVARSRCMDSA